MKAETELAVCNMFKYERPPQSCDVCTTNMKQMETFNMRMFGKDCTALRFNRCCYAAYLLYSNAFVISNNRLGYY